MSAPDIVVATNFSRNVGTPQARDQPRNGQRDDRKHDHGQRQVVNVVNLKTGDLDALWRDDIGAAGAADKAPVEHQCLQHDGKRQRGDGEERAAQPQREVAGAEADDAGHDSRDHDEHGKRQRENRVCHRQQRVRKISSGVCSQLVQRHGRICTDRKKSGRAEIHVAAISAENVPGRCENDELQDDKASIKNVIVAKPECADEAGQADQHCDNEENR
jgi:hypothetical protein